MQCRAGNISKSWPYLIAHGGPVVECSPGVQCAGGHGFNSRPGQTKGFKMVLPCYVLGIKRLDQGNMLDLPIVDCKM